MTRRPRPIFAACPSCGITVVSSGVKAGDCGLVLLDHIAAVHGELLWGHAAAARRRMAADAHGRRN